MTEPRNAIRASTVEIKRYGLSRATSCLVEEGISVYRGHVIVGTVDISGGTQGAQILVQDGEDLPLLGRNEDYRVLSWANFGRGKKSEQPVLRGARASDPHDHGRVLVLVKLSGPYETTVNHRIPAKWIVAESAFSSVMKGWTYLLLLPAGAKISFEVDFLPEGVPPLADEPKMDPSDLVSTCYLVVTKDGAVVVGGEEVVATSDHDEENEVDWT